tara:strand:+ start:300 stop:1433 length:1134 start_codon:yes stop_codon:yes gene_type:complete
MKCRAKPKYILPSDVDEVINLPSQLIEDELLYFNTGRNALTFILQYLKAKKVAMQSFNCVAVLDAVKKAKCEPVLLDIKLSDFSIGLNHLIECEEKIDVLILTHYQGIPNIDYLEINKYCRDKGIVVIEDLAQTIGAAVDDVEVGELGDYSIYSFAIDKPFTCFEGGALKAKRYDSELIETYKALGSENEKKALVDLKRVQFYDIYYQEENYFEGLDNKRSLWCFLLKYFKPRTVYKLLRMKIVSSVLVKMVAFFVRGNSNNPIVKLDDKKIKLVLLQKERFKDSEQYNVPYIIEKYGVVLNEEIKKTNVKVCWNRLSVIDEFGEIKKALKKDQIDCGNFNWPVPLHLLDGFEYKDKYKCCVNSETAAKLVLNIPCW